MIFHMDLSVKLKFLIVVDICDSHGLTHALFNGNIEIFLNSIYDIIKLNQSFVGNIDFKMFIKENNLFCFLLFVKTYIYSYLWN